MLAFKDRCPHRERPLHDGDLDGRKLTCAQHLWEFDVCIAKGINPSTHSLIHYPGHATITMTLTSAACPLSHVMERNIGAALAERGTTFEVQREWVPSWRPSDITPDGRELLRAIGFTAF